MNTHHLLLMSGLVMACLVSPTLAAEPRGFPYKLPMEKPDRPLSPAMERLYDEYLAPTPEANELYSTFKFTRLEGFDYHNGLEHNTIQYSPDGVSFSIAAVSSLMPVAAGPYVPDAFTDTKDGRGITWGLCHITAVGAPDQRHSILARFDCDLSRDLQDPWMKQTDLYLKPEAYFSQGLGKQQREQRSKAARQPQEQ